MYFTILTDRRFLIPDGSIYTDNVLLEDRLLTEALEKRGHTVVRTNWDNDSYDWSTTDHIIFRATWDYFDRFDEFKAWLDKVEKLTNAINPVDTIRWNWDKHYLFDLERAGINIPPTIIIKRGELQNLKERFEASGWEKAILKPTISGGAWHTYLIDHSNIADYEAIFNQMITERDMMLQEFMFNIKEKGEISLMLFGGQFSHAILKKAKAGDFRVQDDHGGTVHDHSATSKEIALAEQTLKACYKLPVYARVDICWDNSGDPVVQELELIEPELWLRNEPLAAERMAKAIDEDVRRKATFKT